MSYGILLTVRVLLLKGALMKKLVSNRPDGKAPKKARPRPAAVSKLAAERAKIKLPFKPEHVSEKALREAVDSLPA